MIREINDPIEKESFFYKIFRVIIRILINLNFNSYIFIKILRYFSLNKKSIITLIDKNFFYCKYLNFLKKGNLDQILQTKYCWANYIIERKNLHNKSSLDLAKNYKNLLERNYSNKLLSIPRKVENIDFYLYGPNSDEIPNSKFFKSTLILTKFPNFSVKEFNKKILFLNSFTINNTKKEELEEKCSVFDLIYIPRSNEKIIRKMKYMPNFPQDCLGSPMGLTRILYCLQNKEKSSSLIIEGFDLGIYKKAYSGKIKSFYSKKNFDTDYRFSLMYHDFIYNFLFLKVILEDFKIYKSEAFLKIINKDLNQYFQDIYEVRNFKKLK